MNEIKKTLLLFYLLLLFPFFVYSQDLITFMKSQPDIVSIKEISHNPNFNNTYEVMMKQYLDYNDTTKGSFLQRVFVSDKSVKSPVVFITEGYTGNYMSKKNYINELSSLLNANQIGVEHRYFGKSVPDSLNWKYLTVENAANDHHRILQLFKKYYKGKWISTGISKGGFTSLAFRTFFPEDVDGTVAYVGPLNYGVEDGRHEVFLRHVGTKDCREKIQSFQKEILRRRSNMTTLLEKFGRDKKLTFLMNLNKVLDYSVLEYSFSFWQWGNSCSDIPPLSSADTTLFNYFVKVINPDYFSKEGNENVAPFFYQAASEEGYYGYDVKPFKGLLSIKSASGYLNRYMVPGDDKIRFNGKVNLMVKRYLKRKAVNVILIYGANDPWTASSANVRMKGNNLKIIKSGGCHKTRIANLPEEQKKEVIMLLNRYVSF